MVKKFCHYSFQATILVFLITGLLTNLSFHASELAERIQYEVHYNDEKVGTLTANKYLRKGKIQYVIKTDVKKRLIKMFHVVFYLNATFSNGILAKAEVKNTVNDNVWDHSKLKWQKDCYSVDKMDEEPYKLCKKQAPYSTACLYFKAPTNHSQIFSESYSQYIPIKGNKADGYTLKLPSGNDNYYHYDSKGLKKAVINDTIIQLKLIRQ